MKELGQPIPFARSRYIHPVSSVSKNRAVIMYMRGGSHSGDAICKRTLERYRSGEKVGLVRKVLADFDPRPSGLVLPGNQVVQRFDGDRIKRVAWKIVRGLYFHHRNRVLPQHLVTSVTLMPPDQEPPEHFKEFMALPDNEEHGQYPVGSSLPVSESHGGAGLGALLGNVVLGSGHNRCIPCSCLLL